MTALVIFVGVGLGGLARYGVTGWVRAAGGTNFPWGTLLVNASGSFLLGLVMVFLEGSTAAPEWRPFLAVGVLGGYTTFSTFSYETLRLVHDGQWERALLYAVGSVVLSLAGALLGVGLAAGMLGRG